MGFCAECWISPAAPASIWKWPAALAEGVARLRQGQIDVVLTDLDLPDSSGLDTFAALKAAARDLPIIVLSGLDDETAAVNAVHAGAEDYLVKDRLTPPLILRAIIYAIERTQAKKATAAGAGEIPEHLREFRLRHLPDVARRAVTSTSIRPWPAFTATARRKN